MNEEADGVHRCGAEQTEAAIDTEERSLEVVSCESSLERLLSAEDRSRRPGTTR